MSIYLIIGVLVAVVVSVAVSVLTSLPRGNAQNAVSNLFGKLMFKGEASSKKNALLVEKRYRAAVLAAKGEDYVAAQNGFKEAYQQYMANDNLEGAANALVGLAEIMIGQKRYDQAANLIDTAVKNYQITKNIHGQANCFRMFGVCSFGEEDYSTASSHFEYALDLAARLEDKFVYAGVLMGISRLAVIENQFDKALALFDEAILLYQNIGAVRHGARAHLERCRLIFKEKKYDELLLPEAIKMQNQAAEKDSVTELNLMFGDVLIKNEQAQEAIECYNLVLDVIDKSKSKHEFVHIQYGLACGWNIQEQHATAIAHFKRALDSNRNLDDAHMNLRIILQLLWIAHKLNKVQEYKSYLDKALKSPAVDDDDLTIEIQCAQVYIELFSGLVADAKYLVKKFNLIDKNKVLGNLRVNLLLARIALADEDKTKGLRYLADCTERALFLKQGKFVIVAQLLYGKYMMEGLEPMLALDHFRMAARFAEKCGAILSLSRALILQAEVFLPQKEWDAAKNVMDQIAGLIERVEDDAFKVRYHMAMAKLHIGTQNLAMAEQDIEQAIPICQAKKMWLALIESHSLKGQIALFEHRASLALNTASEMQIALRMGRKEIKETTQNRYKSIANFYNGCAEYFDGNLRSAVRILRSALVPLHSDEQIQLLLYCELFLADIMAKMDKYDEGQEFLTRIEDIDTSQMDIGILSQQNLILARYSMHENDAQRAELHLQEALIHLEVLDNPLKLVEGLLVFADFAMMHDRYDTAIDKLLEASGAANRIADTIPQTKMAEIHLKIAKANIITHDYSKAMAALDEAQTVIPLEEVSPHALGFYFYKGKLLLLTLSHQDALENLTKALNLAKALNNTAFEGRILMALSEIHAHVGSHENADIVDMLKRGIALMKPNENLDEVEQAKELLVKCAA